MPPLKAALTKKSTATVNSESSLVKTVTTRSSKAIGAMLRKESTKEVSVFPKRKAASPIKGNILKRSALGNITNAIETKCIIDSGKKATKKMVSLSVAKHTISTTANISQALSSSKSSANNLPKSSILPVDSNIIKSSLPPLPKSRLKPPIPPTSSTKRSVSVASVKPIPSTNISGKAVPLTNTAGKAVPLTNTAGKAVPLTNTAGKAVPTTNTAGKAVPLTNTAGKAVPTTNTAAAKVEAVSTELVKPTTVKSPTVAKKPTKPVVTAGMCKVTVKPKGMVVSAPRRSLGRRSTLDNSESSLYISALSDVLDDVTSDEKQRPQPLINIDEEYVNDPHQCAAYAYDIFEYLKSRENKFVINDYMSRQPKLTPHMRAILIDWMVEIQENFELNHETLYLAVKLVDTYLSKLPADKTMVQLIGAAAMLIAAKYDERIPPSIEDFLYICNEAYDRLDMTTMEISMLRLIDFQLGYPLSYRFLRRYARCAKVQMPLLTLARFILEYTLMDYSTVTLSDSKLAAAALYLAFKMKNEHKWDSTLVYFSGYEVKDIIDTVKILNNSLHQKPRQSLSTIRNKYSHKIFYEVAKIPLVSNEYL